GAVAALALRGGHGTIRVVVVAPSGTTLRTRIRERTCRSESRLHDARGVRGVGRAGPVGWLVNGAIAPWRQNSDSAGLGPPGALSSSPDAQGAAESEFCRHVRCRAFPCTSPR